MNDLSTLLAGLSEAERLLVECVVAGVPADLKRQTVRGSVVRDLILEAHSGWIVPHAGVRIHRAIISGGLDLEGCVVTKPFLIWHSRIEGGDRGALLVRDAKLKRLGIHSSTVKGAIVADRVQIESGLFLGGGLVTGSLQIRGAEVNGALAIDGTEIGDGRTALLGAGLSLSGPLILRRARVKGEVTLARAVIGAGIYAEDAAFAHAGVALNVESARIRGDLLFDRARLNGGMRLSNARIGGRFAGDGMVVASSPDAILAGGVNIEQGVSMVGARIGGSVWLEGAEIGKVFRAEGLEVWGSETSIGADVIRIGGNWDLGRAKLMGRISCPGADINGQLRLTDAELSGHEPALRADGARIRGGCFLTRAKVKGLLRFPAAVFGNQFRLRGASLEVGQGAALLASGSTFERDVELNQGLAVKGAIVLDHARIRGILDLNGSRLVSAALARGGRPAAHPDPNHHTQHTDRLALSLVDAEIDRLEIPDTAATRPRGIIDLSRAHVGSYSDFAAAWPPPAGQRGTSHDGADIDHLVLDGFTYEHLSNPSGASGAGEAHMQRDDRVAERRIAWLEGQAACDIREHFKPQAWVFLGQRLAAEGYHDDARTISIARRRRERRSHSATATQRRQELILDLFALYGYNPWRTVLWMAGVVLAFALLWAWAAGHCTHDGCHDEQVFVIANRDAYTVENFRDRYPPFSALGYSFDVFVPFVSFGYEDHWRPNISWRPFAEIPLPRLGSSREPDQPKLVLTQGGVLYVLSVTEMLMGIVLTSLAITGFTGLLRGEE